MLWVIIAILLGGVIIVLLAVIDDIDNENRKLRDELKEIRKEK